MQKMFFAACVIVATSTFSPLNAQLLSTATPPSEVTTANFATEKPEWSLYTDKENSMVYIDFEKINVNLNGLIVKDNAGKVVFKDDALWQLPVNTIYEVDFSKLPKGAYSIELKSFTATLKQEVAIN